MKWKDWVEQNALVVLIGACVATGTTVAGVMSYYTTEKMDLMKAQQVSEVKELKTQIASIARGMGHEEYLDVRRIVVAQDRVSLEPNSQYFDDAEFYALSPDKDWSYSKSNEEELLKAMTGEDLSKNPSLHNLATATPIYLWRAKKAFSVTGDDSFKNVFPYIYVIKVPFNAFRTAISAVSAEESASATTPREKSSKAEHNTEDYLDSLFRGDVAGKLLTFELSSLTSVNQTMPTELLNVQKLRNVVYMASRSTLRNVKIDNVAFPRYYLYSEFVVITTAQDAIMIKTLLPSADPSGNSEYFQYMTRWFNSLRVLAG